MARNKNFILALDLEPKAAANAVKKFRAHIEIFKIGSRLFTSEGPDMVRWVHKQGCKVFLDLKFHDIPKTVAEACRNAVRMRVWGLTVHCSGGFAMMREAVNALFLESERLSLLRPIVFGVTVLTSFAKQDLLEIGVPRSAKNQVCRLAHLAQKAGLDGVVASGNEVQLIRRALDKDFLIAVPGIRSQADAKGDQKRTIGVRLARGYGANYIIVGRPILEAKEPVVILEKMLAEM